MNILDKVLKIAFYLVGVACIVIGFLPLLVGRGLLFAYPMLRVVWLLMFVIGGSTIFYIVKDM